MKFARLDDYRGGWFVGGFDPAIVSSSEVEVSVKRFSQGSREPTHYQLEATEITVIVSGRCRIGSHELGQDDIIIINPLEAADFEALTDVILVAVKHPSLPADKKLGSPSE